MAGQESDDWRDFRYNNFSGIHAALQYNVTRNTRIRIEGEAGSVDRNLGHGILTDNFSGTATQAIPAAQSWIVVDGVLAQLTGTSGTRSTGSTLLLTENSPVPDEYQFTGPDRYQDRRYTQFAAYVEQTLFEKLTLEARSISRIRRIATSASTARRPSPRHRDHRPGWCGQPESRRTLCRTHPQRAQCIEPVTDVRLSGVYELEFPG